MANPEPHSLGEGDPDLRLAEPKLHRWLLTSPTTAEQLLSRASYRGATSFLHAGEGQSPKAGCLKHPNVLPCSGPRCTGSGAAAGSLVVSAAASLQGSR